MEPLRTDDPRALGDFGLLCRIGAGGFGEVFLARDSRDRLAAIKLIRRDIADSERLRPRFRSEVEAIGRAGGPGVPELLGADPAGPRPWLATRYIPGPSLQQLVEEAGPLPEDTVWALAAGLAATLRDLHAVGLFHRDLKPSNVLVTRMRPWVIDFSLVRLVGDPRLTTTTDAMGSFQYAAPEQADGLRQAQGEADVYALGASLLFAVTGHPPRDGENQLDIRYRALTEPPDLRGLPRGALRDLVRDCLEAAPEGRPQIGMVLSEAAGRAGIARPGVLPYPAAALAALERHRSRLRSLAGVRDDFAEHDEPPAEELPATAVLPVPPATRVRPRWIWRCYDWLRSAPVVHDDLVLAVTAGGALYALDRAGGDERWRLELGAAPRGGLTAAGGTVATGTADGSVHVVRIRPGGPSHTVVRLPAPVHAVVFAARSGYGDRPPLVVCSRGDLYLLDPESRRVRWSAGGTGVAAGVPAVDAAAVHCRTDDGSLTARRLADGRLLWSTPVGGAAYAGPVVHAGTVYAASADGTVTAVAADTGVPCWSVRLDATLHRPPVVSGGALVVGAVDGRVTALGCRDGAVLWSSLRSPGGGPAVLATGPDTVYAADGAGVRALSDADGTESWRWQVGGVCGLAAGPAGLLVGGLDGVLRSVNWASTEGMARFPEMISDNRKDVELNRIH